MSLSTRRFKAARSIMMSAVLVSAVTVMAQTQSQQTQSAAQQPTVKINVLVLDDSKHAVGGLTQDDFRIVEDGVPQKISFFSKEEARLLYGLVIDNSGSMRRQLDQLVQTSKSIVAANQPGDETFLVRFIDSQKIENAQDFTSDKQAIARALHQLFIAGGQTAVVDAVFMSAKHALQYKKGDGSANYRRALILMTDGEDRQSYYKKETLIDFLRLNDIQIFAIGLVQELGKDSAYAGKSPRGKAVKLLDRLAEETGGRAFYPKSSKEMPAVVDEITRSLRAQYVIGYTPAVNPKSKSYREVQVTVADAPGRGKLTAITRSGYTVADK